MQYLFRNVLLQIGLFFVPMVLIACTSTSLTSWRVEGFSMEPTFTDGNIVKVQIVPLSSLQRGDIVLYETSNGKKAIKRLIGVPGERVEIHDGQVFINGAPLIESYKATRPSYSASLITLGSNEYYVLGDLRDYSLDSHSIGPLDGKNILGKVVP
jgi:signal peptidase I